MLFSIWEFIINILEDTLFFILTNKKLTLKGSNKQKTYIGQATILLIGSLMLFALNSLNLSTIYTVILGFLFHLVFVQVFFSNDLFSKLLWTIIYTAYAMVSDFSSAIIPIYLLHYPKEQVLESTGVVRIIFTLLYILILTLLVIITLAFDNKTFRLSKTERLIFSVISMLCILIEQVVLVSIIDAYHSTSDKNLYTQVTIFILVFLLFFSLVFYVYNLGVEKDKNESLIEENLLTKLNNLQYEQVITSIEELRILKHDINNHLTTLSMLINTKELDEAANYINKISAALSRQHRLLSSGNPPIDCIVSNKIIMAQNKNITMDYTVHLPSEIPISNVEICSLLGNLLDNAIEANEKVPLENARFIHLYIKPFNNMLSIKIENSSDGIYQINKSGKLISTKNNCSVNINHGIGIKQVCNIVEKYNGFIRFTPRSSLFTVELLLPLGNDSKETENLK